MSASLRVAVVGAGWIAGEHLAALPRLGASVAGVCDLDAERAAAAARPAGAPAYTDVEELLERERPQAVFVCTPPLAHRDPALVIIERGLHLYLEKPIARTQGDAQAIVDAAARSDAVCAIGYQWRALELLDDVRRELEGQAIGLLVGRSIGPTRSRPWFLDRAQGGGNVLERASHQIDLQRAIAGEVEAVQAAPSRVLLAQGAGETGNIEDAAVLTLRFVSGAVGSIVIAWTRDDAPGIYSLDIVAEDATLQLALDPDFRLSGVAQGRAVAVTARQHPLERSLARFLEAARAGDQSLVFCRPADAAATLAVAGACEQALSSGALVQVQ
jgi:predicted dehydrogenase